MNRTRLVVCFLCSVGLTAEAFALPPTVRLPGEARGTAFRRPPPGTGLRVTPEGRLFVLQRRTDRSIGHTREQVGRVEREVNRLETAAAEKRTTCGVLCSQITDRKRELERQRERSRNIGLIGALFGVPAVAAVGLVQMYDNDSSLRDLNARLSNVQSEQRQIEHKIATHEQSKAVLGQRLRELRTAENRLVHDIAGLTVSLRTQANSLAHARLRLDTSRSLLGNLRSQVATLEPLRASAAELGISLDSHLRYLHGELAHAERLVQSSQRAYLDFVAGMLVRGPNRAAQQWLTRRVTGEVTARLQEAGLGKEAAKYLAKRLIPARNPQAQAEFVDRVTEGL